MKGRAIASVVGTIFFVLVLMMAMGAQVYLSGLQVQSDHAAQQDLSLEALRSSERITFSTPVGGLTASGSGPESTKIVMMVLKFSNGTVFDIPETTVLPSGSSTVLQPLATGGSCGSTSCAKRYSSIVSGASQGSVGLLTSLGNTFWFVPAQQSNTQAQYYWTSSLQSTTSTAFVPITGLFFLGSPGTHYQVAVAIGYYQSASVSPGISIGVSAPTGATILACGGMNYPLSIQACTTTTNVPVGTTVYPGNTLIAVNYCTSSSAPCSYLASIFVAMGSTGGTVQLEYKVTSSTTGTIVANSMLSVLQS
jgi:hypothetical protein